MTELFTGNLLVASSLVTDPIYAGGVCLIVHQDDANVVGVMLNRPMKPTAETLVAMFGEDPRPSSRHHRFTSRQEPAEPNSDPDEANVQADEESETSKPELMDRGDRSAELEPWRMLHFGGPLSGPVVAIHQASKYAEAETGSGVYVASQKEHLEDLIRRPAGPYRLIVGHLGWETEQLKTEIASGIWHVVPATVDQVFAAANEMWPRLIRRATSSSMAKWIGIPDVIGASQLN